ncbi:hypothetical protein BJ165DRAFT_1534014 [Panaeolus papilionaceus]|nr:hypothetical protein BJ165DRAFT_1534014 [Panaeolus papilionaceus]
MFPTPILQPALPVLHSPALEPVILPTLAPLSASPIPQFNIHHIPEPAYIENHDWHPVQHHVQFSNLCVEPITNDVRPPAHDNSPMLINVSGLVQVPTGDISPQVNTIAPPADDVPAIVETGRTLRSRAPAAANALAEPPAKKPKARKAAAADQEETIGQAEGGGRGKGKGRGRGRGRGRR